MLLNAVIVLGVKEYCILISWEGKSSKHDAYQIKISASEFYGQFNLFCLFTTYILLLLTPYSIKNM